MSSDQRIQIILSDLTHTGMGIVSEPFPLSVGYVGAYAIQELGDEIEVTLHKFPQRLLKELESRAPRIIGFSSYNWNANLSYLMAAHARRLHPGVITIFGGPDFPLPQDEPRTSSASDPRSTSSSNGTGSTPSPTYTRPCAVMASTRRRSSGVERRSETSAT